MTQPLDTSAHLLQGAALALLVAPLPALVWGWRQWIRTAERGPFGRSVLVISTVAYLLALSPVASDLLIGELYGARRSVTIYVCLGLMISLAVVSMCRRTPSRPSLVVATGLVALVWAYIFVVSSIG